MHMNTRKETSLLHMATSKKAPSGDALASLLGAAQAHVDSLDLESAISTYNKVLKTNPDCVPALDGLGDAYLQAGMRDEAIATLKKSIATSPEGGVERFMNLGQLCDGREALSWLDRGIAALRVAESQAASKAASAASSSTGELDAELLQAKHALASGLCSVAEVFLTDACDEDEAEARCEACATEAVTLVQSLAEQTLAEPYVTLASVRMSQERPEEASALLNSALAVFGAASDANPPPFDVRLSCAKLLMEVERARESIDLLQSLRVENEEALEVWYLLCCAALQAGDFQLALANASAACQFGESEMCPPDEREWLPQLMEIREEASAALGGEAS